MTETILLDGARSLQTTFAAVRPRVVHSAEEAQLVFAKHRRGAIWIAPDGKALTKLGSLSGGEGGDQRLLVLQYIDPVRLERLRALFRFVVVVRHDAADVGRVAVTRDGVRLLPVDELSGVLCSPHRDDLFIGGVVNHEDGAVLLYRGNLEPLVVPMAWFKTSGAGVEADFSDFEIIDYGQTIRLGTYEAAADAVLYEFDVEYRRRLNKLRREEDRSFGGSLRRLRHQKGLKRTDFGEVSEKEIARIERGEVQKPHANTLTLIAKRLGVEPADIETY